MKGKILHFEETENTGKIIGNDGNRYSFEKLDFKSDESPVSGMDVDFDIVDSTAKDIFCIHNQSNQIKSNNIISIGDWFLTILIASIPIIGFIMLFVWGFGSNESNESKANWAKAMLINILIGIVVVLVFWGTIVSILISTIF